LLGLTNHW